MDKLTRKAGVFAVYLLLAFNAIVVLGPIAWTVMASFKPGVNLFSSSFTDFSFTLDHYRALADTPYLQW